MILWLLITLLCIFIQGCYSMIEMAALSFNRMRLQYYVSCGIKRAIWLQYLLKKPYRLFGTSMLAVNIALQVGSQSAREFYASIGLDPDLAPISQIFLVVIFAELSPLFAARRCSEHVIMLTTPIVYFTYRIFSPLIWLISLSISMIYRIIGKENKNLDLSREELQSILETQKQEGDEFNLVVANIFALRDERADAVMTKLDQIELTSGVATIDMLREKMTTHQQPYYPIYRKSPANIVGILLPKDLAHLNDKINVRDAAHPPWFITQGSYLTDILQQFRSNKQSLAVVLNPKGAAIGILTLDTILRIILNEREHEPKRKKSTPPPLISRTFSGNTPISDFNREYGSQLPMKGIETLAQLMITQLDSTPESGDSIVIDQLEFTAEDTGLRGIKSIAVKSLTT